MFPSFKFRNNISYYGQEQIFLGVLNIQKYVLETKDGILYYCWDVFLVHHIFVLHYSTYKTKIKQVRNSACKIKRILYPANLLMNMMPNMHWLFSLQQYCHIPEINKHLNQESMYHVPITYMKTFALFTNPSTTRKNEIGAMRTTKLQMDHYKILLYRPYSLSQLEES